MSSSETLYKLQMFDTELDKSAKRIDEINIQLKDHKELEIAAQERDAKQAVLEEKQKLLRSAENHVEDQNHKIGQNQKKLYGGAVTNPKELEDLQLESTSLAKHLSTLEERQLEAMLEVDQAQKEFDLADKLVMEITEKINARDQALLEEKNKLDTTLEQTRKNKKRFIETTDIPDLASYQKLREELNGIAVTLMVSNSCSSCGSNIPSAIAQEVRSPGKTANCPTCKRILHPG